MGTVHGKLMQAESSSNILSRLSMCTRSLGVSCEGHLSIPEQRLSRDLYALDG
jgi:hypothetical protein